MNVLFVAGSYFPNASANTVCMEALINAIKQNGNNVSVLIPGKKLDDPDVELINGNKVYKSGSDMDLFFQMQEKCSQLDLPLKMHGIHSFTYAFFRAINKIYCKLRRVDFIEVGQAEQTKSMSELILNTCDKEKIELIVSVSVPFGSHLAVMSALSRMSNKPKWMMYMLDPYGASSWINPGGKGRRYREECETFSKADRVIMMNVLKGIYSSSNYDTFREKFRYLKPPLFDLKPVMQYDCSDGIEKREGELAILFAGTLYDECRNYNTVLDVLEKIVKDQNARVHIMGNAFPHSKKTLEKYTSANVDKIIYYGRMPYDYAKSSMCKADILINIGNDYTDIIPSKIFEYMAAGKPILNFYRIDDDTTLPYLTRYPLCLNIDERNDSEDNYSQIKLFISDIVKGMTVSESQMREIFSADLTEQVQKDFVKMADECMKE